MQDSVLLLLSVICATLLHMGVACPSACSCQGKNTDCSNQDLLSIPQGIPRKTRNLNLANNGLQFFSGKEIIHLTSLRTLDLNSNEIETVDEKAFENMTSLRKLFLQSNSIRHLYRGMFSSLTKLIELDLSNNLIQNFDGVFSNMRRLARLDISANHIHQLSSSTFDDLIRLRHLLIDQNSITSLDTLTFQNLTKLNYLELNNNPLTSADNLFLSNTKLEFIELTKCSLQSFPNVLPKRVKYLQMGSNNITTLRVDHLKPYKELQVLVIDQNQIDYIEDNAFASCQKLQNLWLNQNMLKNFPMGIPNSVKELHLDNNEITSIEGNSFQNGSQLEILSLQSNFISNLTTDNFKHLSSLKKLLLGGNYFSALSQNLFSNLNNLEMLSLIRADLRYIHNDTFQGLAHLTELDMSFILIINESVITGNFFSPLTSLRRLSLQESPQIAKALISSTTMLRSVSSVRELNLMDNSLTTLSITFMTSLPQITLIKLSGNQFHCDRRLVWFHSWLKTDPGRFEMVEEIECYTPMSLHGISILDLPGKNFVPTTVPPFYPTPTVKVGTVKSFNDRTSTNTSDEAVLQRNITTAITIQQESSMLHTTVDNVISSLPLINVSMTITSETQNQTYSNISQLSQSEQINNSQTALIAIATSVAVTVVIAIIIIIIIVRYVRKKSNLYAEDTFKDTTDIKFFVPKETDEPVICQKKLTREDRGSVTSKPEEDITNECIGNMKVYTWDHGN